MAVVCVGASGCLFDVSGLSIGSGAGADFAVTDLAMAADQSAAPNIDDLAPPADLSSPPDLALPFCGEPNLVACYQFEDGVTATTATDGTPNRNDLTLTTCTEVPGGHTGGGLDVHAASLAHANHNATLDIPQLTVEMWIKPAALPATLGARAGLADED